MPTPSAVDYSNLLGRSRLLSADEVRALLVRWQSEVAPKSEDGESFVRWLVAGQYLTTYQADALRRGHVDRFFLGEYKLLERIGQGRMAGVFKAVHRLGQMVAIKVLPPSKTKNPEAFGRFQREARLAQKLDHANVVRTFGSGEDRGLHYIVMEHLDGETLEDVLRRRSKLPLAEAVPLLYQALLGLQHLHEQGMVHRDLKPSNLMLLPARGRCPGDTLDATVKILDVGLGRALFDEGAAETGGEIELTAPGEVLGNPDYMAPEQARDSHAADIRADLYSLGCIFYDALAGQPPFPDNSLVGKIRRHATETPRSIKCFNPEIPDELEGVLERLLAKKPADRYATPAEATEALRPFLPGAAGRHRVASEGTADSEPPSAGSSRKQRKGVSLSRRDCLLLAAGATCVAGGVIAGLLLRRWIRSNREE